MENVLVIRDQEAETLGRKGKRKHPCPVSRGYEVSIKRMQYLSGLYYHLKKKKGARACISESPGALGKDIDSSTLR